MNTIYILGGSNLGNSEELLKQAESCLVQEVGEVVHASSVAISAPWGFHSENKFYNKLWVVETSKIAFETLEILQSIEVALGRKPKTKEGYESRFIDLDILFFNDEIIQTQRLTIPHPLLHKRLFTLDLLVEIAPDFCHPVFQKSIVELRRLLEISGD